MNREGAVVVIAAIAVLVGGCSSAEAVYTPTALPDAKAFPYVAEYMEHRCGSLDCHGSVARNLRVYGDEGLRLLPSHRPCVPVGTTDAEVAEDYASIVGLEPETLNAIVADRGANAARLTLIAKPLGLEEHKGGTLFHVGDDGYVCMTSWLSGVTDKARCLGAMPKRTCGAPTSATFDGGVP